MFQRILLLTDLTETTDAAIAPLRALHQTSPGAVVHLFHASLGASDRSYLPAGMREQLDVSARLGAESKLEDQAAALRATGMAIETHTAIGSAYDLVLPLIEQLGIDLVLIPTRSTHSLVRRVSNSVTGRTLQHGHVPVLTMNAAFAAAAASWAGIQRIVHPVAMGEDRGEALTWVESLAASFGASLELVHVVRPLDDEPGLDAAMIAEVQATIDAQAQAFLARRAATVQRVPVTTALLHGSHVGGAICAHVEAPGASLIAMPNFDTSRTHNTVMGSVTEWVIRHAVCPVLIHGQPSGPAAHLPASIEVTVHDWLGEGDGLA